MNIDPDGYGDNSSSMSVAEPHSSTPCDQLGQSQLGLQAYMYPSQVPCIRGFQPAAHSPKTIENSQVEIRRAGLATLWSSAPFIELELSPLPLFYIMELCPIVELYTKWFWQIEWGQVYSWQECRRDTMDYKNDHVYQWLSNPAPARRMSTTRQTDCFSSGLSTDKSANESASTGTANRLSQGGTPASKQKKRLTRRGGKKHRLRRTKGAGTEVSNVVNLSKRPLSAEQTDVLSKGLSFVPSRHTDPFMTKIYVTQGYRAQMY